MSDEKMKELSLDDLNGISGGVGFDAPWEFLDSIPDEKLRKAWAVAFCIPQNFSSWAEFDSYFEALEKKAEELAKKYDCRFVDNETPYERVEKGHPTIVDYFYHEEVRGTANSGKRNVIHNS